jgi:hypothetical protein
VSPRRARRFATASLALPLITLLAGCSGKPPSITRVFSRVVYLRDVEHATTAETLGVYLVANDPDGIEDLRSLYIIDDAAELYWQIARASWSTATAEGETWIGTGSFSMSGGQPVPAGEYRAVLQDLGGSTVEEPFTVPVRTVAAADAAYPIVTVADGAVSIAGSYPAYEIWAYGKDGSFVTSIPTAAGSKPLELVAIAATSPALAAGFSFRVYAWDEKGAYGLLVGPYPSGELSAR